MVSFHTLLLLNDADLDKIIATTFLKSITALGRKQALWDTLEAGREKKGELAITSLEFEYICIKKVDVKC